MTRFTNSPYEAIMQQVPKPVRSSYPEQAPAPNLCEGCKRYGERCIRPCYRDVEKWKVKP